MQTRVALNFQAADDIQDIDQADLAEAIDQHPTLGVEFPFMVGLSIPGGCGARQIAMARLAPPQLGVFEQRGNP